VANNYICGPGIDHGIVSMLQRFTLMPLGQLAVMSVFKGLFPACAVKNYSNSRAD
jgi:hypothetical protein